jgi:hypothetical protein
MQAAQLYDDVTGPPMTPPLELAGLIGRWKKTNEGPQWIRGLDVLRDGDSLAIHVEGDAPPAPRDWGTARAEAIFANGILSSAASAFIAKFDFGEIETELQANANLGLLVVACFHRFKEGSGRADLFTREFFWREDA